MLRKAALSFLLMLLSMSPLYADYGLPPVAERFVFVAQGSDLRFNSDIQLEVTFTGERKALPIDKFCIQHYIFSDGICFGIQDSHPRSAQNRILEVQKQIAENPARNILIEALRVEGSKTFIVSYLKVVDAEVDFSSYQKNRHFVEGLEVTFAKEPQNGEEFLSMLRANSKAAFRSLGHGAS